MRGDEESAVAALLLALAIIGLALGAVHVIARCQS
jgi:hypothetical protein